LVPSAAEYRKAQIEAHGDADWAMFFLTLNQAINRYLFQIEDRHEELESPSERTASDLADRAYADSQLFFAAAGVAPGKSVPKPAIDPIQAINRNADIATELARRAAGRGGVSATPQAFGSRSHLYFKRLNERLDRRLVSERSPFRVSAEEFRDISGDLVPRHSKGSIGADVVVRDARNPLHLEILDLRTHGGTPRRISGPRQVDFEARFGVSVREIYRTR
ncbi:MAG: hypothetical protein WD063_18690, partial [Pirellulales bacterium]